MKANLPIRAQFQTLKEFVIGLTQKLPEFNKKSGELNHRFLVFL